MIKTENINGAPKKKAIEIIATIKAENKGRAFGSHSDNDWFYFFENQKEADDFYAQLSEPE